MVNKSGKRFYFTFIYKLKGANGGTGSNALRVRVSLRPPNYGSKQNK